MESVGLDRCVPDRSFRGELTRTLVALAKDGTSGFAQYLDALEEMEVDLSTGIHVIIWLTLYRSDCEGVSSDMMLSVRSTALKHSEIELAVKQACANPDIDAVLLSRGAPSYSALRVALQNAPAWLKCNGDPRLNGFCSLLIKQAMGLAFSLVFKNEKKSLPRFRRIIIASKRFINKKD